MDNTSTKQIEHYMRDNGLSNEDVLLILRHHVNDLQFDKELSDVYENDRWDDWSEGDMT